MKKIHSFLLITLVAIVSSCSKDPIISNHNQVGISKVTYYVNITLTGASSISVIQGSPFTDPGVKGNAGGVDVPVITTGTVDVSTPGSYTLSYSATNSDGFSSAATRTVYVIPSAELPGVDLSGDYMTTGGTPDATITKVAPGVYTTTNCWGNGSAAIIPAYFFCTDGATVTIPLQNGLAGHIQTTMPGTYVNGLISWQIIRLDFAPPLTRDKTWQKL
jgi:hypothetical protein